MDYYLFKIILKNNVKFIFILFYNLKYQKNQVKFNKSKKTFYVKNYMYNACSNQTFFAFLHFIIFQFINI